MDNKNITPFYEDIGKWFGQLGGSVGKSIDQANHDFRHKGMNGTPEEREVFLKQCFHAARFNMRVALQAVPRLTQKPAYDKAVGKMLEVTARQARETEFDDAQTELYVEVHRKAYESLAEEFGIG